MTEPRINAEVLAELKDILEEEFGDLVTTYIRDTKRKMTDLVSQVEQQNFDSIHKLAHSLKGASSNLGVIYFTRLCHDLEQAAIKRNLAVIKSLVEVAQEEATLVCAELERTVQSST